MSMLEGGFSAAYTYLEGKLQPKICAAKVVELEAAAQKAADDAIEAANVGEESPEAATAAMAAVAAERDATRARAELAAAQAGPNLQDLIGGEDVTTKKKKKVSRVTSRYKPAWTTQRLCSPSRPELHRRLRPPKPMPPPYPLPSLTSLHLTSPPTPPPDLPRAPTPQKDGPSDAELMAKKMDDGFKSMAKNMRALKPVFKSSSSSTASRSPPPTSGSEKSSTSSSSMAAAMAAAKSVLPSSSSSAKAPAAIETDIPSPAHSESDSSLEPGSPTHVQDERLAAFYAAGASGGVAKSEGADEEAATTSADTSSTLPPADAAAAAATAATAPPPVPAANEAPAVTVDPSNPFQQTAAGKAMLAESSAGAGSGGSDKKVRNRAQPPSPPLRSRFTLLHVLPLFHHPSFTLTHCTSHTPPTRRSNQSLTGLNIRNRLSAYSATVKKPSMTMPSMPKMEKPSMPSWSMPTMNMNMPTMSTSMGTKRDSMEGALGGVVVRWVA